jgi:hypothetical protein
MPPEVEVAMFHLDYLSCFLTILATVLVGRKSWTGLLMSIVNSMIVCVIGFRTSQFGFIPANLICICVYAFSIRSWVKKTHTHRIRQRWGLGLRRRRVSTLPTWISLPDSPPLVMCGIDRPDSERSTKSGPRVGHPCRMFWSLKVRGITPPDT